MEMLLAHRPLISQKIRSNENPSPRQVALKTYNDIKGRNEDDDVSSKVKHATLRVLVHRSVVGDAVRGFSPSKSGDHCSSIDQQPNMHTLNQSTTTTHNTPPPITPTLSSHQLSPPSRQSAIGVYNRLKNEDELSSNIRVKQAALRTLVQRSVIDNYDQTTVHHVINESSCISNDKDQSNQSVSPSNNTNVSSRKAIIDDDEGVYKSVTTMSSLQSSPRSTPRSPRPVTILSSSDPTTAAAAVAAAVTTVPSVAAEAAAAVTTVPSVAAEAAAAGVPAAVITTKNTTTATSAVVAATTTVSSSIHRTGSKSSTRKPTKTGRNHNTTTSQPPAQPAPSSRNLPVVPKTTSRMEVSNNGKDRSKTQARQRAVQAYRSQVMNTSDHDARKKMSSMRVLVLQSVVAEGI